MTNRIKKQLHYIIPVLALIASACSNTNVSDDIKGSHEVAIKLDKVVAKNMMQPIYTSGLLFSETEAVLSFKIGGIIQEILVEEGDAVYKGQLLARLDLTEINAQVIQAKNGLEKVERNLERVKRLYEDEAATLENVQDLTTAYNVAKESLRIATFNQKFAEIRAVSNGRIIKKMKNQGELVSTGMPIFFMNDTSNDQWKLEVGLADKDWAKLKEGDKAFIRFDAYPENEFAGSVLRLAEGADPLNGSYLTEIQVNPENIKFAAGLFAEAKIIPSNEKEYHVIPVEALVEGFGKNAFVFVLNKENNGVEKIPIEVAFLQDNKAAIVNGLESVSEVVTAGSGYLTEYSSIKIIKEEKTDFSSLN